MTIERVSYPQKKVLCSATASKTLRAAPLVVLAVDYEKVNVEDINGIRRKFEQAGVDYFVAKNNLFKKAIEGTDKRLILLHFSE